MILFVKKYRYDFYFLLSPLFITLPIIAQDTVIASELIMIVDHHPSTPEEKWLCLKKKLDHIAIPVEGQDLAMVLPSAVATPGIPNVDASWQITATLASLLNNQVRR